MKHTANELPHATTYRDLKDKVTLVTGGASGIYFDEFRAGNFTAVKKLMLIK